MDDLISRQAALNALINYGTKVIICSRESLEDVQNAVETVINAQEEAIKNLPAASVRENVKGKWVECTNSEHYKCSECGFRAGFWIDFENSSSYELDWSEWLSDFCPNCGADMRGLEDE